jgi:subtilisin family serine protease
MKTKRNFRDKGLKLLTAMLTVALVLTLTPQLPQSGGQAAAASGSGTKALFGSFQKDSLQKKDADGHKATYVKGEAIVLVRSAKSTTGTLNGLAVGGIEAFGKSDLPKGVTIEEKVHFDGSTSKDAKAGLLPGVLAPVPDGTLQAMGSGGYVDAALLSAGVDILKVKSSSSSTKELIKQLMKNPKVVYAEPNYRIYSSALGDTFKDYLWQVDNTGQNGGTAGKDVDVQTPWAAGKNGSGVVIATLDTGFDFTHEDLQGVAWTNNSLAKLAGKNGYDFINRDGDPQDDAGHGTHVAGIIAAQHNSKGVAGIAPGVKIMPLKILDDWGEGDLYGAIEAYEYVFRAMTLGVKVKAINNSWGSWDDGESEILKAVIDRVGDKGALSVCAAGNGDFWTGGHGYEITDRSESIPACIESPYIISVAASTEKGELADFSLYSEEFVDLAAPGASILSSVSNPEYNPLVEKVINPTNTKSAIYDDLDGSISIDLGQADCTTGAIFATESAVSVDNTDFFGAGGGSLKWEIPDGHEGELYNLYIPYPTSAGITPEKPVSFHVDLKIATGPAYYSDSYWGGVLLISDTKLKADGSLPDNYMDIIDIENNENVFGGFAADAPSTNWENLTDYLSWNTINDAHALVFTYMVGNDTAHEIRLDNIGISKPNDPATAYEKYAFYSGTSMATPVVTGAVALVAQTSPGYGAKKLGAKVRTMATPAPALAGKVRTGGILDLGTYDQVGKPWIDSAMVSGSAVKLSGFFFGNTAGTVAATAGGIALGNVAVASWKDEEVTLPGANLKNRIAEFVLTKGADKAKASQYLVKGKSAFTTEGDLGAGSSGGLQFTTDGKTLYFVGQEGMVFHQEIYTYDDSYPEEDYDDYAIVTEKIWAASEPIDAKTMFPGANQSQLENGSVRIDGGLPYVDGKFYGIAVLDAAATAEYALASYDPLTDKWSRLSDRPGAEVSGTPTAGWQNLRNSTLAGYNGKLYLIGGYDGSNSTASRLVRIFDPATKKWSAGPTLPAGQGRFNAEARQVGNKLLVTLGGDGTSDESKTPNILILEGSTWTSAPGIPGPVVAQYYEEKPYYTAAVGIVNGGLIFCGLAADKLGDTYVYNTETKKYTASTYQLSQNPYNFGSSGIAVGGVFYVTAETTPGYWLFDDYTGDISYIPGTSGLFRIGVGSGLHTVTGAHVGGVVQGHGAYLPGQKVTLKAVPKKGYYFKQLKVDSKAVKGASHTFTITKDTKADATFVKYKTKVKLNKTSVKLKPGKSVTLKATVTKAKGKVKSVKWTSSNSKYASVSKTGKVTAKRAGLGKTVIITATAKDGSKKHARAVIKIFTKKIIKLSLKAKSKKVKAGKSLKITAKFSPSKGVLRALKWNVTAGKKYAEVSATGTLQTFPGTRGKTVTVTATATDGSKKKASIKIKIN